MITLRLKWFLFDDLKFNLAEAFFETDDSPSKIVEFTFFYF